MEKILFTIFIFFIFASTSFAAQTYHVRTDGHDSNCNGLTDEAEGINNPNCAFLTIQHAIDQTDEGGDYIYVAAGTYYEKLTFTQDGSEGLPITIDGAGATTIVDGSDAVTAENWVDDSGGIADYPSGLKAPGSFRRRKVCYQ